MQYEGQNLFNKYLKKKKQKTKNYWPTNDF